MSKRSQSFLPLSLPHPYPHPHLILSLSRTLARTRARFPPTTRCCSLSLALLLSCPPPPPPLSPHHDPTHRHQHTKYPGATAIFHGVGDTCTRERSVVQQPVEHLSGLTLFKPLNRHDKQSTNTYQATNTYQSTNTYPLHHPTLILFFYILFLILFVFSRLGLFGIHNIVQMGRAAARDLTSAPGAWQRRQYRGRCHRQH